MDFEIHPAGTGLRLAELHADLVRERNRIAYVLRLLDDYRERGAPFPTFEQLMRALLG